MKDLSDKSCKSLKKENEEDIRRWKLIPCLWIGRFITVKMAIPRKAIYKFNTIPIKIPNKNFTDFEKYKTQFHKKRQQRQKDS